MCHDEQTSSLSQSSSFNQHDSIDSIHSIRTTDDEDTRYVLHPSNKMPMSTI
jgi:hypothetical protein